MRTLRKSGGNWVEGEDRFFDREVELEALTERVRDGTHTLLTAQRRMGKTSLVRELLRRLKDEGRFETIFVDLEGASTPADAISEIGFQSRSAQGAWGRIRPLFTNVLPAEVEIGGRVPALADADLRVKLRAGVDAGNWRHRGDEVFAALAGNGRPVVLAIDELPILVNRLLKGDDYRKGRDYGITPERRRTADELLSWLRKNGQTHRGRVCMILSGSVSLEPILQQAGLSAHANIFSPFDLKPWDRETAMACPRRLGGDLWPRPPPRHPPGHVPAGCGARFPTTCSASSTPCTKTCAGPAGAAPRSKTWSAYTTARCWGSGGRWTWCTTRAG